MSIIKVSEDRHNGYIVSLYKLDKSGLVKIVREVFKLKLNKSLNENKIKRSLLNK